MNKRQYKKFTLQCFDTEDGFFVQIKLGRTIIDSTSYRNDEESAFEQAKNIIDGNFVKAKELNKKIKAL